MDIKNLIEGDYRNISHVNRFSGVSVIRPENVAEHTFYVAFFAWFIAEDLIKNGVKVSVEEVLKKAIIHDFEEAMSGDIIRTFKYYDPDLKAKIDAVSKELFNDMIERDFAPLKKHITKIWENCKDGSMEGRIVAFADLLSVLSYTTEEISKGNKYMIPVRQGCYEIVRDRFGKVKEFEGYIKQIHDFMNPAARTIGVNI